MKKIIVFLMLVLFVSFAAAGFELNQTYESFSVGEAAEISSAFLITNMANTDIEVGFSDVTFPGNVTADTVFLPEENIILESYASQEISYSFMMPDGMHGDAYFEIIDNETNIDVFDIHFSYIPDLVELLSIPNSKVDFGEVYHNQTKTGKFTFNAGDIDLTNIEFDTDADTEYDVKFDPENIEVLPAGESREITVSVRVPFGEEVKDDVAIGGLIFSLDQGMSAPYVYDDFFMLDVRGQLKLSKVRATIGGKTQSITETGIKVDEPAKPLESIKIEVEVENMWNEIFSQEIEIGDVEAEIIIIGIDEDNEDVELKSNDVTLDYEGNERKHMFSFDLEIPMAADDETYNMEVRVSGEDDDDNSFDETWVLELAVERDEHDLIISNYDITPQTVSCESMTVADFEIVNLGKDDEDYVRYTLENAQLGIRIEKSRFEISSDVDDDENRYRESIPIKLENPAAGTYAIELRIYRDYDILEGISGMNLIVQACGRETPAVVTPPAETKPEQPEEKPAEEEPEEEEEEVTVPIQKPNVNVADSPPIIGMIVSKTNEIRESRAYVLLLLMAYIVIAGLMVMAVFLYKRRKVAG